MSVTRRRKNNGNPRVTRKMRGGATKTPPGKTPPGKTPPGKTPPGKTPPGKTPPGTGAKPANLWEVTLVGPPKTPVQVEAALKVAGLFPLSGKTVLKSSAGAPAGKTPPGKTPPGKTPPGKAPPGKTPPGKAPPGKTPPGKTTKGGYWGKNYMRGGTRKMRGGATKTPPGKTPPGKTPPGKTPPGKTPPGKTPPGTGAKPANLWEVTLVGPPKTPVQVEAALKVAGLFPLSGKTVLKSSAGAPAGKTPAGKTPPGKTPPGKTPPGKTPPGKTPPGKTPPGKTPPGKKAAKGGYWGKNYMRGGTRKMRGGATKTPPGKTPPGKTPPGKTPPGKTPPGTGAKPANLWEVTLVGPPKTPVQVEAALKVAGLFPLSGKTVLKSSAGAPAGKTPPGKTPPGKTPPGKTPPGKTPPGKTPPGKTPPGKTPPGKKAAKGGYWGKDYMRGGTRKMRGGATKTPPGKAPPGKAPPGKAPPGKTTPGTKTDTFTVALDPTKPKAVATKFKIPGEQVTAKNIADGTAAPGAPGDGETFTVALDPTKPKPLATKFKIPGEKVTAKNIPDDPGAPDAAGDGQTFTVALDPTKPKAVVGKFKIPGEKVTAKNIADTPTAACANKVYIISFIVHPKKTGTPLKIPASLLKILETELKATSNATTHLLKLKPPPEAKNPNALMLKFARSDKQIPNLSKFNTIISNHPESANLIDTKKTSDKKGKTGGLATFEELCDTSPAYKQLIPLGKTDTHANEDPADDPSDSGQDGGPSDQGYNGGPSDQGYNGGPGSQGQDGGPGGQGGPVQADPYAQPGQPGYVDPYAQPGQPGYQDPETGMVVPPQGYQQQGYQQQGYQQQGYQQPVRANPNAQPGQAGYVDPDAQPGQPGYQDPVTGMVVPPASYSSYSGGPGLRVAATSSTPPTEDAPDAFPITVPIEGVTIQVGEFDPDYIEHLYGTLYIGCTEDDSGQRMCATAAGGKYDRQEAERTITEKLRAADTGGSARANPNSTVQDVDQMAMAAAAPVGNQLNIAAADANRMTAQYTSSCNSITNPQAKAACKENANQMASLSASSRGAAELAKKIGRRLRGGSRNKRSKARRGSAKRAQR